MTTTGAAGIGQADADGRQRAHREAIAWFVRLASGTATEAEHRACEAWRAADPAHDEAWARVQGVRTRLKDAPAHLTARALAQPHASRRSLLQGIALVAGTAGTGWVAWRGWQDGGELLADQRTAVGEQREVALSDGSLLMMNTGTAVGIRFNAAQRLLRLHAGEILVVSAHERGREERPDPRPLIVETQHGRLRALGTRFLVRADRDATQASVLSSAVEAQSRDGRVLRIGAGQRLALTVSGLGELQPAGADTDAWVTGSLIVDNWPLADVLAELARYRRGHLGCDPAVAGLRVSGAFPVRDTDQALAALAASQSLRVDAFTRYWVTLRPRAT